MKPFKAFRIHSEGGRIAARFEDVTLDDLAAGEVVIRVACSDINYKDALAATGAGKILRRYPLVGGIDLAGAVESSGDARFKPGDAVLVTGCGLSETHDGGYAQFARVPGDWVIPMPRGLDAKTAMSLGTAGFTAALAIHRMEQNGQVPDAGPIVVTGATGGVNAAQSVTNFQFTPGAATPTPVAQITPVNVTGYSQNMIISASGGATRPGATSRTSTSRSMTAR